MALAGSSSGERNQPPLRADRRRAIYPPEFRSIFVEAELPWGRRAEGWPHDRQPAHGFVRNCRWKRGNPGTNRHSDAAEVAWHVLATIGDRPEPTRQFHSPPRGSQAVGLASCETKSNR